MCRKSRTDDNGKLILPKDHKRTGACVKRVVYALIACIRRWTPKIRIARFML